MRARLYVGRECGLCEHARLLLAPFERRGRIAVELVDVATDSDLFRRYGLEIPVLEIENGPVFRWPFDAGMLRRMLR